MQFLTPCSAGRISYFQHDNTASYDAASSVAQVEIGVWSGCGTQSLFA
jgi:hypothetical protein